MIHSANSMVLLLAVLLGYYMAVIASPPSSSSSSNERPSSAPSSDQPKVYYGVSDGCKLINCSNGTYCAVRNFTVKMGERPYANVLFPKCIRSGAELNNNTDPDGNSHVVVNGPGCRQVRCSQGYQCQVRVSTVKIGDFPYGQSIGGFPSCASTSSNVTSEGSPSSVIPNGPGCERVANCSSGCVSATGIGKGNAFLPYEQYFWPMCV